MGVEARERRLEALEGKRRENELAVRTVSLTKRFGGTEAVTDLCLQIPAGCLYGLVGPNGAGKSTTVGMLTGSILPTSGRIELFGRAYDPDSPWFKMRMGVVSEVPALFSRLSGAEQLQWTGVMFGMERAEAHRRAEQLLALVGLEKQGNDPVADYSRGMKKKLALA
ncbi:MAG: ABC transporter ATP-binding protein, partial [Deltaproteobacteria bacterium]